MLKLKITTVRLTGLDLSNIRRVMAHIRRMNREAGIHAAVTRQDAITWALHRCVLLIAEKPVKGK